MTFDVLLANLRHASTNLWTVNKKKNLIKFSCGLLLFFLKYVILLKKLRFDLLVVLEDVVRVDNAGCQSGTRS